jgi:hypothetical protein
VALHRSGELDDRMLGDLVRLTRPAAAIRRATSVRSCGAPCQITSSTSPWARSNNSSLLPAFAFAAVIVAQFASVVAASAVETNAYRTP